MNTLNFLPFPIIKTERLVLRQLIITDAEDVYALRTNKDVTKFIDRPPSRSKGDGLAFVNRITNSVRDNSVIYWVITLKDNPKLIGSICLWNFSKDHKIAEVGYELFPEHQGKGIMSEALIEVLNFGFNFAGFNSIEAFTHKDNLDSKNLLLKHGFIEDKGRVDVDNANNIIFIKQND